MLDAQVIATQSASLLLGKLGKIPAAYRDLADQARRAATSIPLNIAEASGRTGKDRAHHFRIAYGSAQEGAGRSVREADGRHHERGGRAAAPLGWRRKSR